MNNSLKHNEDGTTTIYIESLDRILEMHINTVDFQILESRGYSICVKWDERSRTWYARSGKKRVHRLLKGDPEGMHVHHKDGNGLNNTQGNLEVVTPSEHARIKRSKAPIVGDRSKGVKVHILRKAGHSRQKARELNWFRLEVNGIHYGTFHDEINLSLHSKIAYMVVNEKATDEQIYEFILSRGHNEEHVATVIKEIRKFLRTPNTKEI